MKKVIPIAALFVLGFVSANAQPFQKGTSALSALIGLGSSLGYVGSGSPAISVNFEHGMWDAGSTGVVSIGGYAGYKRFAYNGSYYKQSWNYTIIGARAAYHYLGLNSDNLDVYGGLMLSYNMLNYKIKYTDGTSGSGTFPEYGNGSVGLSGYVGGRYFFTPNLAANAELGFGVSYLNVGISFLLGGGGSK